MIALGVFGRAPKLSRFHESVVSYAGLSGSEDVINFLLPMGASLEITSMAMAAFAGHLDLVKHMRLADCDWDERVCWMASMTGHLYVI